MNSVRCWCHIVRNALIQVCAPIANLVFSLRIFLAILSVPDVKIFTRIAISARFLNAFPVKAVSVLTLHSNVKNV